jgi:hypothetical protein
MAVMMIESLRRRRTAVLATAALAGSALALSGCGGGSSSATGSSPGEVASYVPSGAPVYLEATTDLDGPQWTQVDALAKLFPAYPKLRTMIDDSLKSDTVDFEKDVKPLLGAHAAIAGLSLPDTAAIQGSLTDTTGAGATKAAQDMPFVGVVEIADGKRKDVEALILKSGAKADGTHDGADVYTESDSVAAVDDNAIVVADTKAELFKALDAHQAGGDQTLAGTSKFTDALGKLPADVFGQAYIDVGAIVQSAGTSQPQLRQLGLADYQNAVVAASVAAEPDGARVKGVVLGAPDAGQTEFSPTLTDKAPADAIAYVGFSDLAKSVTTILDQARAAQSGDTAQQLDALGTQLPSLLGVSLDDLKALGTGEHAIVVTNGNPKPGAAVLLKVDDGARAQKTLDALRVAVPRLLPTFSPQTTVPAWKQVPLAAGVTGWQLPLATTGSVVYGVDGDLAIIGTSVPAVTAVQRPVSPLSDSAAFTSATSGMPDKVASLLWLNISEAVDAADKLGALKTAPAETIANLRPLKSVTAWTTGGSEPTFEVFLKIAG